ncbi:MAG: phosphatidylserine decarboxylase [Holosporales bacterium]|jgi:phosphatidylserine decarboxylase|nr:phosphatidylserine decarboxylase [Holosporales bacterium]
MNLVGVHFTVHKEGYRFIGAGALFVLLFAALWPALAWICVVLTLFCAFFFRHPPRAVPSDSNLVLSPADGTVSAVVLDVPPPELGLGDEKRYRVSIFLSIFNVHVNRAPISGSVRKIVYHPGSFLSASLDKASVFNERNAIVIDIDGNAGNSMAFVQIAGMIARRIVCDVHEGRQIVRGEPVGLIRFGSRCDIWLPAGAVPLVFAGQTMIGGESVISDLSRRSEEPRVGTVI